MNATSLTQGEAIYPMDLQPVGALCGDGNDFVKNDFYPALDNDLSLNGLQNISTVSAVANTANATSATKTNSKSSTGLSTSSLSSSASDTEENGYTSSDEFDENIDEEIAFLVEKQKLLNRFSVELQQEESYDAFSARADIALQKKAEELSLCLASAAIFPFSEDDDDYDIVDPEDIGNGNIWHKAKKILRSLSKQRGIMYHSSSSVSSPIPAKGTKVSKKRQRRVRFDAEVSDETSTSSDAAAPPAAVDQVAIDMKERRSKCARIDKSHVKLIASDNYHSSIEAAFANRRAAAVAHIDNCEAFMSTLQTCLAPTRALSRGPTLSMTTA